MAVKKVHVKGHWVHRNGKKIWIKPHMMKLPSKNRRYVIKIKRRVI